MSDAVEDGSVAVTTEQILSARWKTAICPSGETCWCRAIVVEDESLTHSWGEVAFVAAGGELPKEFAEHFVELHNAWLEKQCQSKNQAESK